MAIIEVVVCICVLIAYANADVSLKPSGNVSVCAIGSEISLTCLTEGSLIWTTTTGTQLFSGQQPQASEGRFNLVVNSANSIDGVLRLNSTATLTNFQPEQDNGISISCREISTGKEKDAVLIFTATPVVTLSTLNNTSSLISWNLSTCMLYVVTINKSSDGSVYLNIITSDTNTTVTLPTGVEYCVTVLGVDSIGRRGPPSQQQCYTQLAIISSGSNTATLPSPSTPSVDPPPSGVSGGVVAGVVIAAVIVIILTVIATVVVIVYWKGLKKTEEYQCTCHTLLKKNGLNCWILKFVFVPPLEANFQAIKEFYKEYEVFDSHFDCHLKSSDTIGVEVSNKLDKWTVHTVSNLKVHKATIEGYTGEGSPPHIEMMITAASDKTTPPDLTVEAKLKGVNEPNIIKFEKEAQNVVECVFQVFYRKIALNHWTATVAFFPKKHEKEVNELYQDANNHPSLDIKFGGGVIKVSTDDTVIPAGWEVTINRKYRKVTTEDVEQYTGEGDPPYCEMTLGATDSDNSDLIILQPVTLIGVRQLNNRFNIERALEAPDGTLLYTPEPLVVSEDLRCVCQVFYHKLEGINYWKATLAFFTRDKTERVKQFYQNTNFGPTIEDPPSISTFKDGAMFKPRIQSVSEGWNLSQNCLQLISRRDVVNYNGVGKPPYCEMVFKAVSDDWTPPNPTVAVVISDTFKDSEFNICRVSEIPRKGCSKTAEETSL